jgi:hypothetical protein
VTYDPGWPGLFGQLRDRFDAALARIPLRRPGTTTSSIVLRAYSRPSARHTAAARRK